MTLPERNSLLDPSKLILVDTHLEALTVTCLLQNQEFKNHDLAHLSFDLQIPEGHGDGGASKDRHNHVAGLSAALSGQAGSKPGPGQASNAPLPSLYQQISQQMLGGQMLPNPQQAQELLKALAAQRLNAQQVCSPPYSTCIPIGKTHAIRYPKEACDFQLASEEEGYLTATV